VLVMVSQMNFFRHTDLGFAREAVITVPVPGDSVSRQREQGLQQELLRNPGVTAFSYSYAAPTDNYGWFSDFRYDHRATKTPFGASLRWADTNYFSLYHLKLAAGRLYSGAVTSDSTREFIINETCARKLGLRDPGDALGRSIDFWDNQQRGVVVGVVKDFYSASLKDSMYAVVMWNWPRTFATANIKLVPARIKETLAVVAKAWQGAFPKNYFEYQFLDDKLAGLYKEEEQLGTLYQVFAGIAIFISCLGLYGLISFLAVQRTKEIGIRKVLGASVWQMVTLLSKELTALVLVAFVIAVPVSWYFMHQWLQGYVNRITLGPEYFVTTAAAAVGIAWVTVGFRAVRTARANPAVALKAD
jgi:putative ABC transport system permease protein